jgi:hypothetical protein
MQKKAREKVSEIGFSVEFKFLMRKICEDYHFWF